MTSVAVPCTSEGVQCELGQEVYRKCLDVPEEDVGASGFHSSLMMQSEIGDVTVKIEPELCLTYDPEEAGDSSPYSCPSHPQVVFKCGNCDDKFSSPEDLQNHYVVQHGEGTLFKCYKCYKTFRHWLGKQGLKAHLETHQENSACQSEVQSQFACGSNLVDYNYVNNSDSLNFSRLTDIEFCERVCGDCGIQYPSSVIYETHCKAHNATEPFKCIECSLRFKKRVHLEEHRASHLLVKLYKCKECGKDYSFQWSLLMHSKVHGVKSQYQCTKCGQEFLNSNFLSSHEHLHDLQLNDQNVDLKSINLMDVGLQLCKFHFDQVHPCSICRPNDEISECSKSITTGVIECEECDLEFATKDDLCQHLLLHKNPQAFKCDECDTTYGSYIGLREHVYASHNDVEVHWCEDCGGSGYVNVSLSDDRSWSRLEDHDGWSSSMENSEFTLEIEGADASTFSSSEEISGEENTSAKSNFRLNHSDEIGVLKKRSIPKEMKPNQRKSTLIDRDRTKKKMTQLKSQPELKVDKVKSKRDGGWKSKRGARHNLKKK